MDKTGRGEPQQYPSSREGGGAAGRFRRAQGAGGVATGSSR